MPDVTQGIQVQDPEPAQEQESGINLENDANLTDQEPEQQDSDDSEGDESQEEETIITLDDKPLQDESNEDNHVVRTLRTKYKEKDKRVRELEKQLQELQAPTSLELKEPNKPRLAEFDYVEEKYEAALDKYYQDKRKYDDHQNQIIQEQKRLTESYEAKKEQYNAKKSELKFSDYEYVEDIVRTTLDPTQQGLIIDASDNPALLVYALGKNPEKLKELSEIKNPVHYVKAMVQLESKLKVTKTRKPKAQPETRLPSSGGGSGAIQKQLDRLYEEAGKTGSLKKVREFKRQHNL